MVAFLRKYYTILEETLGFSHPHCGILNYNTKPPPNDTTADVGFHVAKFEVSLASSLVWDKAEEGATPASHQKLLQPP